MSMHRIPLTKLEEDGLRAHGLDIGTPSQLSDVFRQGIKWAQDQAIKKNSPFIDFTKPLETTNGEPVKYIGGDVCEYKQARMCINHYTGQPYGPSPYPGLTIRNKTIDSNTTLEEAIAILPDGEPFPKDKAYLDNMEKHLDSIGNEVVSKQLDAIETAQRHNHVAHVNDTNKLEGTQLSSYMSSKMADYEKGDISSADLVAAAKAHHGIND